MRINILPDTTKRVQLNTKPDVNEVIKEQAVCNINIYKHGDRTALDNHIKRGQDCRGD